MKVKVEIGSHNTLECSETGRVFDAALGQLSGVMKPTLFSNLNKYRAGFNGDIIKIFDSHYEDIEGQKQRDIYEATIHSNPRVHPLRIAKRVVDTFLNSDGGKSNYCANCLGSASIGSKFLRCGKCKTVLYCSKSCQILDWTSHKEVCSKPVEKSVL